MRQRYAVLIVALLAVLAGACGGDDVSETTTPDVAGTTSTAVAPSTTEAMAAITTTSTAEMASRAFVGADGVETDVSDTSRIVSLNGDLTEILFELGLGSNVVAVDVTTTYPPEAAAMNESDQTVGFAQQLTAEAVLAFEPTLVVGDTQVAPPEAIEQLRQAGVPVAILQTRATLGGVGEKIGDVAGMLDVPEAGEDLATRVMGEIEDATTLAAEAEFDPKVAYIYLRGPQVIFLFGAGMPTQAMIEGAGALDAGAAAGVTGPAPLTPEALVAAAPDFIVLPKAGLEAMGGMEAFLAIPGVADTPAAQSDDFLVYDEAYFFNLGPRTGQALMEFVLDLHPDLASTG